MVFKTKVIGLRRLKQQMQKFPLLTEQAVRRHLFQLGERIMADSKKNYVPVVTGALRGSGFVNLPENVGGRVTVTLGYGGPSANYALAVHENPRAGRGGITTTGKLGKNKSRVGQWKYLEIPFRIHTQNQGKTLRDEVRRIMRGI